MPDLIYPELSYSVQGAFFDVYNALRHLDLSEEGWQRALLVALAERGLSAYPQVEYELRYRGYRIGRFYVDILVEGKLLLELKARQRLLPIDMAQVITYLRVADLQLGILVNFGGNSLEFQRIPCSAPRRSGHDVVADSADVAGLQHTKLTGELRGVLYEVHNELGPGFVHMHYRRATQLELRQRDIPYEVKKDLDIQFHGQTIEKRETRLLVVDRRVLLAPIAVGVISPPLRSRFRQYLKILDLPLGLIANFHAPSLEIETAIV
jgi:GxxExxY protein